MPSANMKRVPLDLYPENVEALDLVITESKVPRTRFLRELVIAALDNPKLVAQAVESSQSKLYRKSNG